MGLELWLSMSGGSGASSVGFWRFHIMFLA